MGILYPKYKRKGHFSHFTIINVNIVDIAEATPQTFI